ncbi:MAG TPA: hypothetical protein VMW83_02220 [Spirochaetia bacterium]|nr:hypothetical protein [Spirochaetia bacterium]
METRIIAPVAAVLVLYVVVCLADRKNPGLVLILRFKDQEEAVEGFLRKVANFARFTGLRVEMVVFVDHSRDLTEAIVGRLAGELGFLVSSPDVPPRPAGPGPRTRFFDARPFSGRQLARLSLRTLLAV